MTRRRLCIGIDLDGVVFRTLDRVLERYNADHRTNYQPDQILGWSTHPWVGGDVSVHAYFHDPRTFESIPLQEGAVEVLSRLDERHEIFLVTDTPHSCLEIRNRELRRVFPPERFSFMRDRRIFVGRYKERIMLDVLLDDMPENIRRFQEKGYGRAVIFDWAMNRDLEGADRVRSWAEFEDLIREMEGSGVPAGRETGNADG